MDWKIHAMWHDMSNDIKQILHANNMIFRDIKIYAYIAKGS